MTTTSFKMNRHSIASLFLAATVSIVLVISCQKGDASMNQKGKPISYGSFTDHTYDYLGFASRTYSSVIAIALEAGRSRLYAGIHYSNSIDASILQGNKVAENIFSKHIPNEDPIGQHISN